MSDKIFVVAGKYDQYRQYRKDRIAQKRPEDKELNSDNFVYVYGADTFRGYREVHGVYIGTWQSREDIEDIKLAIALANR